MIVSLIVAISKNRVIGKDNNLIWHLPKDMKYFRDKTTNHHILTGRKNYISIPQKFRPLPNRINIVLTRQTQFDEENCIVLNSIEAGIEYAKTHHESELFIIGGGQIYQEALDKNLVDKMYVTHIDKEFDGDTFFPEIEDSKWKSTWKENHTTDEKHLYPFTFVVYEKMN